MAFYNISFKKIDGKVRLFIVNINLFIFIITKKKQKQLMDIVIKALEEEVRFYIVNLI
jgi:hypothetical protein